MNALEASKVSLELRFLGTFGARVRGDPLPRLHSRKGQALLALLALRLGQEVSREWLAGTLWPESEQSQGFFNLRQCLADLRRALGPHAATCLRSPTARSLCLDSAGVFVDVTAFDAALAEGSVPALEKAIALYRGPLLEGWLEEWVFAERTAREQAYLAALETLATQAIASANPATAVRYLRQVIAVDPLREAAHASLMQALADCGDWAAVIQVYRDLRLVLRRQVNTDPAPEIEALYQRLRQQSRRPLPPSPATERACSLPSRYLPVPLTSLIGREREVEEVVGWLGKGRLVTLVGAGGVGKTRLAIGVGEALANVYPDGVWLVELAALGDPALVPQTVARVLGVEESADRSITETLAGALAARSLLLVLDNCEHLLDACAALAQALLSAGAGLRVLCTSRQPLGLTGERIYRVPSLTVPPDQGSEADTADKPITALLDYAAVRLFVERAVQGQPGFRLTRQNAPLVARICRRLDGIPLALELAAARVRSLSVAEINVHLDDRFHFLSGGSRTALPRHQTLRALMDWSYDLLSLSEQALLRRLSVFAGGWTLKAAEAVCSCDGIDEAEVLDLLSTLVDKSLVLAESVTESVRYRLLETLRQYAGDRLNDQERHAVRQRHLWHFLTLAEESEPKLKGAAESLWLNRLYMEYDNFRAALTWCLDETRSEKARTNEETRYDSSALPIDMADAGLRLAAALSLFWVYHGYGHTGCMCLTKALDNNNQDSRSPSHVRSPQRAAPMYSRLLSEYMELQQESNNHVGVAKASYELAGLARSEGDYVAALSLYMESFASFREMGMVPDAARAIIYAGMTAMTMGDFETAHDHYAHGLAFAKESGDLRIVALGLLNMGNWILEMGDSVRAMPFVEEALSLSRQLSNNEAVVADALKLLGSIARLGGDMDAAISHYEEAVRVFREAGNYRAVARGLARLGHVVAQSGDGGSAIRRLRESVEIYDEISSTPTERIDALEGFADAGVSLGLWAQAVQLAGAAAHLREIHAVPLTPMAKAERQRCLVPARTNLSDAAFATAWEQGAAMTLDEAIAYALDELEERQ